MKTLPSPLELCAAYAKGYFPMPDPETEEIDWYRPDPRAILPLDGFHVSHSLRRTLNSGRYEIKMDQDFRGVMDGCAARPDTWINAEFKRAYGELFDLGYGHSVEVYEAGKLVGGTYGLALNAAFFAESKFHTATDASKVALFALTEHLRASDFLLLEVQFLTPHLASLGAKEVFTEIYEALLQKAIRKPARF